MASSRFLSLGGTARRHYDVQRRQVLSYRLALKLQGIFPERRAAERKAAGVAGTRKRRCDAGRARGVTQPVSTGKRASRFVRTFITPSGKTAEVRPLARRDMYQIIITHIPVGVMLMIPRGTRRRFMCGMARCDVTTEHQYGMVLYMIDAHYIQACHKQGVFSRS
jgi:hypothetical protein